MIPTQTELDEWREHPVGEFVAKCLRQWAKDRREILSETALSKMPDMDEDSLFNLRCEIRAVTLAIGGIEVILTEGIEYVASLDSTLPAPAPEKVEEDEPRSVFDEFADAEGN